MSLIDAFVPRPVSRLVRRHPVAFVVGFAAVMCCAAALYAKQPKLYEASSTLVIGQVSSSIYSLQKPLESGFVLRERIFGKIHPPSGTVLRISSQTETDGAEWLTLLTRSPSADDAISVLKDAGDFALQEHGKILFEFEKEENRLNLKAIHAPPFVFPTHYLNPPPAQASRAGANGALFFGFALLLSIGIGLTLSFLADIT